MPIPRFVKIATAVSVALAALSCSSTTPAPETPQERLRGSSAIPSLNKQLQQRKNASQAPSESRKVMQQALATLRASGIEARVPQVGDTLPDATLLDANGTAIKLSDAIDKQPAIITFYRGGWCPYCNLQLQFYQEHLEAIKAAGANLVAISPETPDNSLSTTAKNKLKFSVLSDRDNTYGRQIGIVYSLPADLVKVYQGFGIDLEESNDSNNWSLPLSATFVVDSNRRIHYVFADVDYTKRAELSKILPILEKL